MPRPALLQNLIAKKATSTIPIVFTTGDDPVQLGLVASLARPGGNVTGVTQLSVEILPKQIELAHELIPAPTAIALLANPTDPTSDFELRNAQMAAHTLGLQLHVLRASTEAELADAFNAALQMHAGVLVVANSVFFNSHIEQMAVLANRQMLPTIYTYRRFVLAGGLISYGPELTDSYCVAGGYTGQFSRATSPLTCRSSRQLKLSSS